MNRLPTISPVVAALLCTACGSSVAQQAKQPPPQVTIATPLERDIVDWDDFVGHFDAVRQVEVRPRISGHITSKHYEDGQVVRAGQLLYRIDSRPLQAALRQAQADEARARTALQLARTELNRASKLLAADAVSREEYEAKQAAVASAAASLESARATVGSRALDVEYTQVRAPLTGRISDTRVGVGNLVQGSAGGEASVLTTIVAIDPIRFEFQGSEAVYLKYQRQNREGTRPSSRVAPNPVEIRLQDDPSYSVRGRMDFVDNVVDRRSGTIRGRAVVQNPDGFLTPGMFGRMRLLGSGRYKALLVPDTSIVTDQTRRLVMTLARNGRTVPKPVELGPLIDGLRIVRAGLARDDQVIIAGLQRVRPGDVATGKRGVIRATPSARMPVPAYAAPPAASAKASAGES